MVSYSRKLQGYLFLISVVWTPGKFSEVKPSSKEQKSYCDNVKQITGTKDAGLLPSKYAFSIIASTFGTVKSSLPLEEVNVDFAFLGGRSPRKLTNDFVLDSLFELFANRSRSAAVDRLTVDFHPISDRGKPFDTWSWNDSFASRANVEQ